MFLLFAFALIAIVVGFLIEEEWAFIFALCFFLSGGIMLVDHALSPKVETIVSINTIEYAMNKCSPFGGLLELHNNVIICEDKTKINFEPKPNAERVDKE